MTNKAQNTNIDKLIEQAHAARNALIITHKKNKQRMQEINKKAPAMPKARKLTSYIIEGETYTNYEAPERL